jgi:hypothetical protein
MFPGFEQQAIANGDTGLGHCWLIEPDEPGECYGGDTEWLDYDVVSGTPLDVWRRQSPV